MKIVVSAPEMTEVVSFHFYTRKVFVILTYIFSHRINTIVLIKHFNTQGHVGVCYVSKG